jgi:hypothetical protein
LIELAYFDMLPRRSPTFFREEPMATPARTLAGVAVKARAAAMHVLSELWEELEEDLNWDQEVIRNLIEDICSAAGMLLPFARMLA